MSEGLAPLRDVPEAALHKLWFATDLVGAAALRFQRVSPEKPMAPRIPAAPVRDGADSVPGAVGPMMPRPSTKGIGKRHVTRHPRQTERNGKGRILPNDIQRMERAK